MSNVHSSENLTKQLLEMAERNGVSPAAQETSFEVMDVQKQTAQEIIGVHNSRIAEEHSYATALRDPVLQKFLQQHDVVVGFYGGGKQKDFVLEEVLTNGLKVRRETKRMLDAGEYQAYWQSLSSYDPRRIDVRWLTTEGQPDAGAIVVFSDGPVLDRNGQVVRNDSGEPVYMNPTKIYLGAASVQEVYDNLEHIKGTFSRNKKEMTDTMEHYGAELAELREAIAVYDEPAIARVITKLLAKVAEHNLPISRFALLQTAPNFLGRGQQLADFFAGVFQHRSALLKNHTHVLGYLRNFFLDKKHIHTVQEGLNNAFGLFKDDVKAGLTKAKNMVRDHRIGKELQFPDGEDAERIAEYYGDMSDSRSGKNTELFVDQQHPVTTTVSELRKSITQKNRKSVFRPAEESSRRVVPAEHPVSPDVVKHNKVSKVQDSVVPPAPRVLPSVERLRGMNDVRERGQRFNDGQGEFIDPQGERLMRALEAQQKAARQARKKTTASEEARSFIAQHGVPSVHPDMVQDPMQPLKDAIAGAKNFARGVSALGKGALRLASRMKKKILG